MVKVFEEVFILKAKYNKLLLASVAVGVMTPFFGGGVVHAEYEEPTDSSNNTVTVEEDSYTIEHEGETEEYSYSDYFGSEDGRTAAGTSETENVENNTLNINGGTVAGGREVNE